MKTRTISLALALLAGLAFTACGGKEAGNEGGSGGGGTTSKSTMKKDTPAAGVMAGDLMKAYDKGLDGLKPQADDGNFGNPGFTGLAVTPFLLRPGGVREEDREFVDECLDYLVKSQKEDGGIYGQGPANYQTCVSIMALTSAPDGDYGEAVKKALAYVEATQNPDGGIGYSENKTGKSDLGNTQFAMEALRKAGVPQDDPVYSKALKFLQSIQNDSESNDAKYELEDGRMVVIQNDGGAFYAPGVSKAGMKDLPDGKVALRSYGSMTYALLKCYLLAGLPKDDPRVQATVRWIRNNFSTKENPGFDSPKERKQGYFYYLMTMAKALDLLGVDLVKDADGIAHDWRKEITAELLSRQQENGSWVNQDKRWYEGIPTVATSYALIALSHCKK